MMDQKASLMYMNFLLRLKRGDDAVCRFERQGHQRQCWVCGGDGGEAAAPDHPHVRHVVRALARINYKLARVVTHAVRADDVSRAVVVIVLSAISKIARRTDARLRELL